MIDKNYYTSLGVHQNASPNEIKEAFKMAARRLHPDLNVAPGATELFLEIKEAYDVLMDPVRRSVYDGDFHKTDVAPPPLRITPIFSRAKLPVLKSQQLHYVLLNFEAIPDLITESNKDKTPINLALIIDNSTSMQGDRLNVAKASAIEIIRSLDQTDKLALLTFNDRAEIVLPADNYSNDIKSEGYVRRLQARGGTEIYFGLSAALSEIQKNLSPYYSNHIILLTDGHTYGDEQKCEKLARNAAELGVSISCLGIGSEWNDQLLDSIAALTGGSSVFVRRPSDISTLLKQTFDRLGNAIIENMSLDLEMGPGVKLQFAFRLEPEGTELPCSFPQVLGQLHQHKSQSILFEFRIDPIESQIENLLLANGHIAFILPKNAKTIYRIPINLVRATQWENRPEPAPYRIVEAMSRLTLYRMQTKIRENVSRGNFQHATTQLQYIATQLLAKGETELAKTALTEAKNLTRNQSFSSDGDKKIKYGTRSLVLPGK